MSLCGNGTKRIFSLPRCTCSTMRALSMGKGPGSTPALFNLSKGSTLAQ